MKLFLSFFVCFLAFVATVAAVCVVTPNPTLPFNYTDCGGANAKAHSQVYNVTPHPIIAKENPKVTGWCHILSNFTDDCTAQMTMHKRCPVVGGGYYLDPVPCHADGCFGNCGVKPAKDCFNANSKILCPMCVGPADCIWPPPATATPVYFNNKPIESPHLKEWANDPLKASQVKGEYEISITVWCPPNNAVGMCTKFQGSIINP